MLLMNDHKIGDHIYLDATMFLKNTKMTSCHTQVSEGDIVKTKYGPQYICKVTAVRLKGLSVKIIDIDDSKKGHYSEWPECLEVLNDDSLTNEQKHQKLLEMLG